MSPDGVAVEQPSPQEMEHEIERTRERMSRRIDELEERLNPHNLKRQARDALAAKAQSAATNAGQRARQAGSRIGEFVADRPWGAAAGAAAMILLLAIRARGRRRSRRSRAASAARRLRRAV